METKLFNYVKSSCLLEDVATIINCWREDCCGEAEASVFNLTIESDFNGFKNLYGKETAERCLEINPYWFGGLSYYANVLDKGWCCRSEIFPLRENNYIGILRNIVSAIEEAFNIQLNTNPISSYDIVIETYTMEYQNLIDFKKYTLDTREDYKKNCIVPRYIWAMADNGPYLDYGIDFDFDFSDKIFVTIADCYGDMLEDAKKFLVDNIRLWDKDIYSMACKKNDEILLHIGTNVSVYKIFEIRDNAFIPCYKNMKPYTAKCNILAKDIPL